jgi:hypothetical protein
MGCGAVIVALACRHGGSSSSAEAGADKGGAAQTEEGPSET